ncbi:ubiquitin carboxyl-terminal hydrolase MINDY-3-like [Pollicipes pollicipes]|uniref:ubiquitin carboxyl-terminal hydrolase MINDY-3-like n=1 Tax=Pollicipes pollicipes TaxID=41117 RepID=UPI001884D450|nr:ubiquitin carboxyl-terminal hydrolase MINDY-3-like [Pollicipes pollicipes]
MFSVCENGVDFGKSSSDGLMASGNTANFSADEILSVVWGRQEINESVFNRWNQGFVFSADEPCALVQYEGGPCSVIAPVQAHIFKNMYEKYPDSWEKLTAREANELLASSLSEILGRCAGGAASVRLVTPLPSSKRRRVAPAGFHAALRMVEVSSAQELEDYFRKNLSSFRADSGVLAFLYSLIQTKGVQAVQAEMGDSEEPLVHAVHGHGSQSLTNLLITGRAVAHVWDNVKSVGGIALEGVLSQPGVGFLTLLERLHYCTVGWNLKNPRHPVWVLASETHLTVLFAPDDRLTAPPSARQLAQRAFDRLDREQSGFIPTSELSSLMAACDLVTVDEYVELMRKTLDPDQLGIVLRVPFLDEFFPEGAAGRQPDAFTVYHCNGLIRSNPDGKVKLVKGDACLLETDVQSSTSANTILTCLQSKWPRVDVRWHGPTPSIN